MRRPGPEKWMQLVAEFASSGLEQKEFVAKHDVSLGTFQYWLYKKSKRTSVQLSSSEGKSRPAFLPLEGVASLSAAGAGGTARGALREWSRGALRGGHGRGLHRVPRRGTSLMLLGFSSGVRILLAREPIDMRNSIDGLAAIVRNGWQEDLYAGHLFVFVSRRGDRLKILTWDAGGFVLTYKRLEKGRFRMPQLREGVLGAQLDAT